jgi:uncharacterized membrane protein YbjE (DUF340 family)
MLIVFVALVIGVALGASGRLPAWARRGASVVTMAGLVVLLCAMGASIGADEQLLRNLGEMGLQAGALAGSATLGSVVAGWGWERLVGRRQEAGGEKQEAGGGKQEAGSKEEGSAVWLTALIAGAVLAGVAVGALKLLPSGFVAWLAPLTSAALGVLLFGIGIEIGYNRWAWRELRRLGLGVLGLPLAVAVGSIVGALGTGWGLGMPLNQASAIGAGFGWYSLSGVLLAQLAGASVGALAFLANVLRELLAVLTMPFLARYLGRAAAVAAGGATSMDSTLPVVVRAAGSEAALLAFTSGAVLTALVPILVPLLIRL